MKYSVLAETMSDCILPPFGYFSSKKLSRCEEGCSFPWSGLCMPLMDLRCQIRDKIWGDPRSQFVRASNVSFFQAIPPFFRHFLFLGSFLLFSGFGSFHFLASSLPVIFILLLIFLACLHVLAYCQVHQKGSKIPARRIGNSDQALADRRSVVRGVG